MRRLEGKGAFAGVFAALLFAAVLVGACGVLLESALRAHAPVDRYAAADAVVTGPQKVSQRMKRVGDDPETQSRPVAERARVPVAAAGPLRSVPGVRAVVADVSFPVLTSTGFAAAGHGWESAALRPYELSEGRAPQRSDEVVLSRAAGVRAGSVVRLQAGGAPRPYRVTGLVSSGPAAAFFATATATALAGHPGQADALAVLAGGKPDAGALRKAAPGLSVATGAARGDAEDRAVAAARPDIVEIAGSFGGVAVMTALVVVGGLIVLSVRERGREFALLRAVGATPWQVRGRLVRETARAAVPAGAIGGVLSLGAGAAMHGAMIHKGVLPDGFGLSLTPLPALAAFAVTVLAATVSALLASLRISRIRPVQALGESAAEPTRLPRWRVITGAVLLVAGANALGIAAVTTGPTASASLGGLVMALIVAVALLGPLLARAGERVLGRAAAAMSPVAGRLARHAAGAAALRAGSVMTPVALAVAFAGVQLFAQSTVVRATAVQFVDGNRADQVIVAGGPGLPQDVADAARRVPGVTAATPVKRTTVVMAVKELGEKNLRSLTAQGVGADAAATMDPKVASGGLGALRGNAVALSRDVAGGLHTGSTTPLWLGDGTRIDARVVAVYDRGLGFGDVLLPHDLVAAHSSTSLDDHVLVRGHADLRSVTAAYLGARAVDRDAFGARLSDETRLQGFVSHVVVGAIAGFILIGLVTTLALATAARRREFALLRLVGATRRQVLRMLRLEALIVLGTGAAAGSLIVAVVVPAFATAVTGLPLPAVSPVTCAAILAAVAGSGAAAVLLPARAMLRRGTSAKIG
ncbi:FtsX-like permease family protein [Actinomadura sp. LD22]|uniref:FtsX-like permease family protein n=1 Tax=Actinomadura physcomitrii TaxID=2650748 RepID=A0A6I4MRG0_9ACTN|nr:ABC transporter permease [Actinomadura physcomitrii]MWA06564.1 FtsX-like permease family protein [Actinomadura physcomitrii]